ncbi:MAG: RluA family pseudouridine synthase [Candidatus Pacebacteria bacterium]|jgi:23S rRNA pseudouridine1911/1915/1917 synthase|nr:RluA family pseudouridine synthase [Candidatus Paceibacterota bacterium]
MQTISILYENEHLLVIDKPSGLVVHADGKTDELTLVDWLLQKYPEIKDIGEPMETTNQKTGEKVTIVRPGIVHRIDRDTSGCLVIAKNQEMYLFLKRQFQERKIDKTYKAIVWGCVKNDTGKITAPIGRSGSDFRKWTAQRGARGELREAVTEYKVLDRFERGSHAFSFVEVCPKTGRTHQIRVHFKYLNHPILCDTLYAEKLPCVLGIGRLALHAAMISFTNLQGENITVEAPLPDDFVRALK